MGREVLDQIHRWLANGADLAFVPLPWRGIDGETLQGRDGEWWELAPWMPGTPDLSGSPSPGRVREAFGALGQFHARLGRKAERGASPGLSRRGDELEGLVQGGYEQLAMVAGREAESEIKRLAVEWVRRARLVAPEVLTRLRGASVRMVDLQPCLRDTRPEHFLFTEDRLTGLVDYGAMGIDCIAGDLARLASDWIGPDVTLRRVADEAYCEAYPRGATSFCWRRHFEESQAVMGGARWIRWAWMEGRVFEPGVVEVGLRRALRRLETLDRVGPSMDQRSV